MVTGEKGQLQKKMKEQRDVFPTSSRERAKPTSIGRLAFPSGFVCVLVFFTNPWHWQTF